MRNTLRSIRPGRLAIAACILVAVVVLAVVKIQSASAVATPAPIEYQGTERVPVAGTSQTTSDGLRVTFDRLETTGTRMFFHFTLKNTGSRGLTTLAADNVHEVVIVGQLPHAAPGALPGERRLSAPTASEAASGHIPLAVSALASGASASGWLAVDSRNLGFVPDQVLYRYAVVHTTACQNPLIQSTCHPADLYSALIWDL